MQQEPVLEKTNNWAESTAMTIYCIRLSVQWISGLAAKDDIGTFLIMKSKKRSFFASWFIVLLHIFIPLKSVVSMTGNLKTMNV